VSSARPTLSAARAGRVVAASLLANLALTGVVLVALRWPDPKPITFATATGTAAGPRDISICVGGAVRYPGVYRVQPGATVGDAVKAAGGAVAGADLDASDAQKAVAAGSVIVVSGAGGEVVGAPLDINRASASELEELPGIGPTLAQRIVEHRESEGPFSTVEELMNVRGVGERTLDGLRGLVVVR
jgi:competence protein ComEA